jgi:hypothetical protein
MVNPCYAIGQEIGSGRLWVSPSRFPASGLINFAIGTILYLIGHKGAVWSSKLSLDTAKAVTGSADFTASVIPLIDTL